MTQPAVTQNKATVRKFFEALEHDDVEMLVDLFADDGQQINPYHSGVFPTGAKGKEEIHEYWAPVIERFDGMAFYIDELLATEDPNMIFVRYRGEIKLPDNGGVYANDYYSTFRLNDMGKIIEYVEIFNPITAAKSFGLLNQIN